MKGNPEIIDKLNYLLEGELTAINQYMLHAEMCEDWGYSKLSHGFKTRSIQEMHHAERLMERILFLEGTPIVSNLSDFNIGKSVPGEAHGIEIPCFLRFGLTPNPRARAARILARRRSRTPRTTTRSEYRTSQEPTHNCQ